jgi:hypothetical protein
MATDNSPAHFVEDILLGKRTLAPLGTLDVTATVNQTTVNTQLNLIAAKVDALLDLLQVAAS